ncbi:alpha-ribazole phosphatase family protein [Pseudothauera rhizosphaerae]|uniref:Phosphoglycerate mutase n=1 Tax=Pseudothauera rhizosphaerae TaxID=2565932 RepID=A0A4S4AEV5_9RHOO|nr:alpha-ribazole phosphatase family protein [Pseudothauera rhizosphaerae]THF57671.1 phosphoglycerate mutase [Pseudothauera rhizosphaerae]
MELHLIRHPRPDVPPGTCYGQRDVGLAEPPAETAARLRPLLPAAYELHASPLARARLLAEELGRPQLDGRLKEIHFGDWEGRLFSTLGAALDEWAHDPLGFRAPGGESAREMSTRVLHWLDGLLASAPQRPVVVVAHGGPLRAIAGHLLGLPAERWLGLDFACGHATRLDVESWGVVLKWFNR